MGYDRRCEEEKEDDQPHPEHEIEIPGIDHEPDQDIDCPRYSAFGGGMDPEQEIWQDDHTNDPEEHDDQTNNNKEERYHQTCSPAGRSVVTEFTSLFPSSTLR